MKTRSPKFLDAYQTNGKWCQLTEQKLMELRSFIFPTYNAITRKVVSVYLTAAVTCNRMVLDVTPPHQVFLTFFFQEAAFFISCPIIFCHILSKVGVRRLVWLRAMTS